MPEKLQRFAGFLKEKKDRGRSDQIVIAK